MIIRHKSVMIKSGLFFLLLHICCSKDIADISDSTVFIGQITKIESRKNIQLGQNDTILVTFSGGTNGCAQPDHLEATFSGFSVTLKAFYKIPSRVQICPAYIPIHKLKYIFKPSIKGTYNYKSFDTDVTSITIVN